MSKAPSPHSDEDGYELCDYPSDPGQQHSGGWSGRELARVEKALVVSISPDVCLTPIGNSVVPIPYSIVANPADDVNPVNSVRLGGRKAYNMVTKIEKCTGDQPGTKKGVKSGTVGDVCEPKEHAPNIRFEGKYAIRNREIFWMNSKNTIGELIFQKSIDTHWT